MVHPYDQLLARMTKVSTASLIARAAVISSTPYSITWKQGLIGFENKLFLDLKCLKFHLSRKLKQGLIGFENKKSLDLKSVKKVEARIDRICEKNCWI